MPERLAGGAVMRAPQAPPTTSTARAAASRRSACRPATAAERAGRRPAHGGRPSCRPAHRRPCPAWRRLGESGAITPPPYCSCSLTGGFGIAGRPPALARAPPAGAADASRSWRASLGLRHVLGDLLDGLVRDGAEILVGRHVVQRLLHRWRYRRSWLPQKSLKVFCACWNVFGLGRLLMACSDCQRLALHQHRLKSLLQNWFIVRCGPLACGC